MVVNDNELVVRLDTLLTDELKQEGMAREIVRNIQDARKQLNLEINDKIKIDINTSLDKSLEEYICRETIGIITLLDEYDLVLKVCSNDSDVLVKIKI